MKRKSLILVVLLSICLSSFSQEKIKWTPFLHQTGMYYTSDVVTSDGFGLGLGVNVLHESQLAGQADVNVLWGNGNAITTRLALGYEKKGRWAPGVFATFNMIWGQRIEILSETGEEPPMPAWIAGLRIVPLKFQTNKGYVSALELGYGFGPEKGRSIEFSILSVGLNL